MTLNHTDDKMILVVGGNASTRSAVKLFDALRKSYGDRIGFMSLEEYDKENPANEIDFFILDDLIPEPVCDERGKQSDYKNRRKEYWQKSRW